MYPIDAVISGNTPFTNSVYEDSPLHIARTISSIHKIINMAHIVNAIFIAAFSFLVPKNFPKIPPSFSFPFS